MYPPLVYLNGAFLPAEQAQVSVFDRGFVFADGVYEVIPAYGGRSIWHGSTAASPAFACPTR